MIVDGIKTDKQRKRLRNKYVAVITHPVFASLDHPLFRKRQRGFVFNY